MYTRKFGKYESSRLVSFYLNKQDNDNKFSFYNEYSNLNYHTWFIRVIAGTSK